MPSYQPLRLLLVSDSAGDVALIAQALRQRAIEAIVRTKDATSLSEVLRTGRWDAIFCVWSAQASGTLEALAVIDNAATNLPVVVLADVIDEKQALACLERGAGWVLYTYQMGRLPWVLDREMRRSAERAQQLVKNELDRAALDQTLQDLHNLVAAMDEACIVAVTDPAGKIQRVNSKFCEISGYNPAELLGQDHRIVNSATHPPEFMRELWKTIGRGQVWRGEIRNRAKGGHHYWVDSTIVPLLGPDGKPKQYIAIRHDITPRKAAEARLRDQATLTQLGAMATVVAHEVRNPLAASAALCRLSANDCPKARESGPSSQG